MRSSRSMMLSAAVLMSLPIGVTEAATISPEGIAAAAQEQSVIDHVQYRFSGREYCWYDDGWRGPGFYRCGYRLRVGYGWGGPSGWHGWRVGGGDSRGRERIGVEERGRVREERRGRVSVEERGRIRGEEHGRIEERGRIGVERSGKVGVEEHRRGGSEGHGRVGAERGRMGVEGGTTGRGGMDSGPGARGGTAGTGAVHQRSGRDGDMTTGSGRSGER
jgi:hypothetical protein